jgi:transcriptional regulator with XRE-family HTH domain
MADSKRHRELFGCDDALNKKVAGYLTAKRKGANLSQQQLADKMGVDRSVVSRIESASDNLSLTKLVRYVEALGPVGEVNIPIKEGEIYIIRRSLSYWAYLFLKRMFRALSIDSPAGTLVASSGPEVSNETTDDSQVRSDPQATEANEDGSQDDADQTREGSSVFPELHLSP